ncbi:hypothetical protein ACFOD9_01085 [Novosphingobium bradum]|uniref:DUF4286 family protein n=1 Tax=Novosphingobium bradum TaxID=1737444 RepID=A0ABV7IQ95_9SPHN
MTAYSLVVYSKPVAGREDEYNDWYTNVHLGDVLKIPGITSARRYKAAAGQDQTNPYLALYNVETNDITALFTELSRRAAAGEMVISDAMAEANMVIFEAITPEVTE